MLVKIILGVAVALVGVVAVILGVGLFLPRAHVASGELTIAASPEQVAALIADPNSYSRWRKGATFSDVRAEKGAMVWRETAHGKAVDYALTEEAPDRRWRSTILTKGLPYNGYWIIEVETAGQGVKVRVTEHSNIDNLAFRTLGRFVFGLDTNLKAYLRDLNAVLAA